MSLFGDHLKKIIEDNAINIYGLAKSAGIERTGVHKAIAGNRIPSEEFVSKMVDALPLSPEERRDLLESYKISKIGEQKYRQRIQVKELIESIAYIENEKSARAPAPRAAEFALGSANETAVGHFAVNNMIKGAIEEAVAKNDKDGVRSGEIGGDGGVHGNGDGHGGDDSVHGNGDGIPWFDFVISDNYQFFYSELLSYYLRYPDIRIRHIIAFTKKVDFSGAGNRNLDLLSHVLPFAFAPGSGYYPYYYYSAPYGSELSQAMPFFLVTSAGRLVLISGDFNKAAMISDRGIVDMYRESFDMMAGRSKLLISYIKSISEMLEYFIKIDSGEGAEPSHWIEPEPCVAPMITDDDIENHVTRGIPGRDDIIRQLGRHFGYLRERRPGNINVCTTAGLDGIIETGFIYYAPKGIMYPLGKGTVKRLLTTLCERIADNKVRLLFTDPSKIVLPKKTLININRKVGINILMHDVPGAGFKAIHFSEDSIDDAFSDFIENIGETGYVYDEAASLAALEGAINEL